MRRHSKQMPIPQSAATRLPCDRGSKLRHAAQEYSGSNCSASRYGQITPVDVDAYSVRDGQHGSCRARKGCDRSGMKCREFRLSGDGPSQATSISRGLRVPLRDKHYENRDTSRLQAICPVLPPEIRSTYVWRIDLQVRACTQSPDSAFCEECAVPQPDLLRRTGGKIR